MKKKIGILGGISSASTIQYYKTITDLYFKEFNDYYYPEIIIYSLDFQYFTDLEDEHRTGEYIDYILTGIHALKKAGADFVIMAANSPHSVLNEVKNQSGIEILSIVEAVAQNAKESNLKKTLLTGIKYTMQSDFYQKGFEKFGIEVLVPENDHQDIINDIIFSELVINNFLDTTRNKFIEIVNSYKVDGIILGCTELPLLIKQDDIDIKVLDSLSLHCEAALKYSINN